jgi:hypothetical protein
MRKLELDMVAAIIDRKNKNLGNTTVRCNDLGTVEVRLHGNLIFKMGPMLGAYITLAGWNTPTTRSRINAILSCIDGVNVKRVSTKQGVVKLHMADGSVLPVDEYNLIDIKETK